MTDSDEIAWEGPLSPTEVGELTARWLEGLTWGPWNTGSAPDPETAHLVPYLAVMNRSGYVTENSQPGSSDPDNLQRATVSGYCREAQAECLASLSLAGDLIVVTQYPRVSATYEIPVTQSEGRTFTIEPGALAGTEPWLGAHPATTAALADCHHVAVIDPRWGRDDLLWPSVVAALERDPADCAGGLIDPAHWEA